MSFTMLRRLSSSLRSPRRRSHHLLASFEINQLDSGPSRSHSNPPSNSAITLLGLSYLCQPVLKQTPEEATSDSKAFFLRYGLDDLRQEEASYLIIHTLLPCFLSRIPRSFRIHSTDHVRRNAVHYFWIYFLLILSPMHFSPHPHQSHFVSCRAKERRNISNLLLKFEIVSSLFSSPT